MSLIKRGKYYHYAFMVAGVRYHGSTKETTKTAAMTFEALLRDRICKGDSQPSTTKKSPMLSEVAQRFLCCIDAQAENRQLAHNTKRCYHNGWRMLSLQDIANTRIDQIRTNTVKTLSFPGGPSNANQALRTLRRILSYACEEGILRAAPRIQLQREHGREAIVESWLEELLFKFAPQPLFDVIAIILDSGMRPEEVMRMRWEHIHWDHAAILVPYGKTQRSRRFVPLTDRVSARLRIRKDDTPESPWVFPAESNSGHRVNVTKQWLSTMLEVKSEVDRLHLPPIPNGLVLYSLRHTCATRVTELTGDLAKVQRLLGHSSLATTQKYLHPEISGIANEINRRNRSKGLRLVEEAIA